MRKSAELVIRTALNLGRLKPVKEANDEADSLEAFGR